MLVNMLELNNINKHFIDNFNKNVNIKRTQSKLNSKWFVLQTHKTEKNAQHHINILIQTKSKLVTSSGDKELLGFKINEVSNTKFEILANVSNDVDITVG